VIKIKHLKNYFLLSLIICLGSITGEMIAQSQSEQESGLLRLYEVNKRACDFPEKEDFSNPEAAYATINRLSASGDQGFWRRVSTKKVAARMQLKEGKRKVSKSAAKRWLNAEVIEVRIFREKYAGVIARVPHLWKKLFDYRSFELEDGKWLNAGNSVFGSLDEARTLFRAACGKYAERPKRPKIGNPEAFLKPFVEFLKTNGEEPKAFVMRALAKYKVTIMGEVHHRPPYWAFNSSLVAHPDFAKSVGTIYMELPSNKQELIDKFLTEEKCDTMLVIEMLRDMLWTGWPDKPMLDFFIAVWKVNRDLKPEQKLRIKLVDMQRPWEKIQNRSDWKKYNVNRDKYMAENIIRDIQSHPNEKRNVLFIVGDGHAALNFDLSFFGDYPLETAGWHLQKKLGSENVYAIMQHRCVMTNLGRVDGRLQLGLFDSAFQALDNKPMAFALERGPFGEQMYDGRPDKPIWSRFRDGFNAYLYLGLLETEKFSPLIDGFYTEDFVKEVDRRHRMMFGRGWAESYRRDKMDAESFIAWMGNSWGKPRRGWHQKNLGPINVWHRGGRDWKQTIQNEKLAQVMEHPEEIVQAAKQLFENIRDADYDDFLTSKKRWNKFPTSGRYMAHHWHDKLVEWICKTFKDNPIVSIELGEVFIGDKEIIGKKGWPTVPYKLTLQDGTVLEGDLPFEYNFDGGKGHWHGMEGIDWHLQSKNHRGK